MLAPRDTLDGVKHGDQEVGVNRSEYNNGCSLQVTC